MAQPKTKPEEYQVTLVREVCSFHLPDGGTWERCLPRGKRLTAEGEPTEDHLIRVRVDGALFKVNAAGVARYPIKGQKQYVVALDAEDLGDCVVRKSGPKYAIGERLEIASDLKDDTCVSVLRNGDVVGAVRKDKIAASPPEGEDVERFVNLAIDEGRLKDALGMAEEGFKRFPDSQRLKLMNNALKRVLDVDRAPSNDVSEDALRSSAPIKGPGKAYVVPLYAHVYTDAAKGPKAHAVLRMNRKVEVVETEQSMAKIKIEMDDDVTFSTITEAQIEHLPRVKYHSLVPTGLLDTRLPAPEVAVQVQHPSDEAWIPLTQLQAAPAEPDTLLNLARQRVKKEDFKAAGALLKRLLYAWPTHKEANSLARQVALDTQNEDLLAWAYAMPSNTVALLDIAAKSEETPALKVESVTPAYCKWPLWKTTISRMELDDKPPRAKAGTCVIPEIIDETCEPCRSDFADATAYRAAVRAYRKLARAVEHHYKQLEPLFDMSSPMIHVVLKNESKAFGRAGEHVYVFVTLAQWSDLDRSGKTVHRANIIGDNIDLLEVRLGAIASYERLGIWVPSPEREHSSVVGAVLARSPDEARDLVLDAFNTRVPPAHETPFFRWVVEEKAALTGLDYERCEYCGEGD